MAEFYRLLTNPERTVLVRIWPDGPVQVCTRPDADAVWGPPVVMQEQAVESPRKVRRDG